MTKLVAQRHLSRTDAYSGVVSCLHGGLMSPKPLNPKRLRPFEGWGCTGLSFSGLGVRLQAYDVLLGFVVLADSGLQTSLEIQ